MNSPGSSAAPDESGFLDFFSPVYRAQFGSAANSHWHLPASTGIAARAVISTPFG
jgi:hypothetical protein